MGFLDKIFQVFRGQNRASSARKAAGDSPAAAIPHAPVPPPGLITVSVSGFSTAPQPATTPAPATESLVRDSLESYQFVLDNPLLALAPADQWWEEAQHKRVLREGSGKALTWMSPFISSALVSSLLPEHALNPSGPMGARELAKALRGLVRERRKQKVAHDDLLGALYGACVMADFVESLRFEGSQPQYMARFVSRSDLATVQLDFATLGYQFIEALGKTDIKWLVQAFGEPSEHMSVTAAWPSVWRNAVSRKCWVEFARSNQANDSLGLASQSMQGWLEELVRRNIGYHEEWKQRVAGKVARDNESVVRMEAALAATEQIFIVADLETTGLRSGEHEILEFGALRVSPDGTVLSEFSQLVRTRDPVPPEITTLTGITDRDIAEHGMPLASALARFQDFAGNAPVFFHNARFDESFIKSAAAELGASFSSPVHDTLPLARGAWPDLGSYRLEVLAKHVDADAPSHRALADARAALAVLRAARAQLNR